MDAPTSEIFIDGTKQEPSTKATNFHEGAAARFVLRGVFEQPKNEPSQFALTEPCVMRLWSEASGLALPTALSYRLNRSAERVQGALQDASVEPSAAA